jgi:uncharacterized RDD family membrane protein YckC
MSWYYVADGRQAGPVTEEQFRALVASGAVRAETLVWRAGMAAWTPYGSLAGEGAGSACSHCGRAFPPEELMAYGDARVCAACKPVFLQKIKEGVPLPSTFAYGGFWIRFLARVVDGLILMVVNFAVSLPFGLATPASPEPMRALALQGLVFLINFAFAVGYETFFLGRFGATPGKMVCRLRVVRPDGAKLTYGRAAGRYFATILSQITLLIGYIMAAFDAEKRSLHDRICDTRVVKE